MSTVIAGHRVSAAWMAAAVVTVAAAITVTVVTGTSGWFTALGLIGPDLAFLAAIGQPPPRPGRMPRRVIPVYNLLHRFAGPLVLGAVSLMFFWLLSVSAALGVIALGWLGHVVWDRAVGYGLRDREGEIIPPKGLRR